jgi:methyltransferase (TIGR00027 family)
MNNNDKISETAIIVASLRALSNYERADRFRCNDTYAELFLPDEKRIPLRDSQVREMIKKAIPKGMYEYVISRTKYFDGILSKAVLEGIRQVVFLGAGFDSRPYRFSSLLNQTRIFEVDTEGTQEYKKSLLITKIQALPNIAYVSANFEEADLFNTLKSNGFSETDKTLFLWEGVTFYLSKDSVLGILKEIREHSAPGSMICFDFQTMKTTDELINTGLKEESVKFGIEEGKIEEFVLANDYEIIDHLNSNRIEQKFMKMENGDLFGEIAPIMNFLLIEHQ